MLATCLLDTEMRTSSREVFVGMNPLKLAGVQCVCLILHCDLLSRPGKRQDTWHCTYNWFWGNQ